MKKYVVIGIAILCAGLLINYILGGFAQVLPQVVQVDNYVVYGAEYEGSYKSARLGNMVEEMRSYQGEIDSKTDVVIINYIDEAKETLGIVTNFVGLSLKNSAEKIEIDPQEKRIIRASKSIRIKVAVKPLVMPSPEKIKAMAFKLAQEKGYKLQNISIEQYNESGMLIIDFPIKNQSESKLSYIQKLANAYGIESFNFAKTYSYTFNVKKGESGSSRAWSWHPKSGNVMLVEKEDTTSFNHNKLLDQFKKEDHKFINDKYWFLFPFQLVWDTGYTSNIYENVEAPISKTNTTKLTIVYNNEDGYTPGDAYDFYIDNELEIKEWSFRKGNQKDPSLTTTWEDYTFIEGIKMATNHVTADGEFRLWFTEISVID